MDYSNLTTDTDALDSVVDSMLGDTPTFFKEHWRKKPLYVPGAGLSYAGAYNVEQFLADVVKTQPVPYLSVSTREGKRFFTKHTTAEDLRSGVLDGGVSAIKASKFWYQQMPETWAWMRALFGRLCHTVAMTYMTPARSEDVDIFLAGPQSQLGTHFDTTDVFTLQVYGERKWTIDEEVRLDSVLDLAKDREWYPAKEIDFRGPTHEVTLCPGDALYVPAYGVHRVTGVSWSVSLSLGLRAFNVLDFVEYLLESIQLSNYMSYPPITSIPESAGESHVEAKLELMQHVRSLLSQVEGVALATLLKPLILPQALETPASTSTTSVSATRPVLGMFMSGFALDEEPKEGKTNS